MRILDRLVGLETEYAIRFRSTSASDPPSKFSLYQSLVEAVRQRVLTVRAKHFKEGVFTAGGGAIWFEAERPAHGAGLIEGSTPECRGPWQALIYQRAQDRLVCSAAADADVDGDFFLIKNDRDSQDNVYGAQENYECDVATGGGLLLWRCGLILLCPLLVLTWLAFLFMILGMLIYFAFAGIAYLLLRAFFNDPRRLAVWVFGGDLVAGQETGAPTPPWMESVLINITRLVTAPLAISLYVLAVGVAFRSTRRKLVPFLVSRAVIAGSGMIDTKGNFHLADKAPAMNCLVGYGGFLRDRPIFTMGHFLKALCVEVLFSPRDFADLLHRRQRLQIALGDSNRADVAELLRIGTTALVLDALEAGYLKSVPRLRRPIQALHQICADPSLRVSVPLADGQRATGLELQRYYYRACQRFLQEYDGEVPHQAWDILRLWEEALNGLESLDLEQGELFPLVGLIDWVSKRFLLDEAGRDAAWEVCKKIDLRYHELSADGYFDVLARTGIVRQLVDDEQVERAIRSAPANSPATMRSHFIREFSESEKVIVNWRKVVIGTGRHAKTIRLSKYRPRREASRHERENGTMVDP